MKTLFPLFMLGLIVNLVGIFVLFAPPAKEVFPQHPECSVAGFSPDLTQKQRAFCRERNKK
tara:strand:+ start:352 stop:534 length:183 start_codon:yes stop_codon:yes gene_type:complete